MNAHRIRFSIVIAALLAGAGMTTHAQNSSFTSETFDLGVLVSDVRKAVAFYTNAIGFKEVQGFKVPADWTKDAGLTDGRTLDIHVLVLGDGPGATKLKLMEVPGVRSKKSDTKYVPSQLGMRYITIHVQDIDAAVARLNKAGVKPVSKGGAVALPEGFPKGVALALVRDPDGNMVELVGPRKQ